MAPSLCGPLITSKRSLLALMWTLTTLLSLVAFLTAVLLAARINARYHYLASLAETDDDNGNYNNNAEGEEGENKEGEGEGEDGGGGSQDQGDYYYYPTLAYTSSGAMTFVGLYTSVLALSLSLYGSTAIVGFTSLRGEYIEPCFSAVKRTSGGGGVGSGGDRIYGRGRMNVGIFGGALVLFANLLLVTAVILGEFRVEDYLDEGDKEEMEPYAIERVATILAVTCMSLAVVYLLFAGLLFIYHPILGSDMDDEDDDLMRLGEDKNKPLVGKSGFLTGPPY